VSTRKKINHLVGSPRSRGLRTTSTRGERIRFRVFLSRLSRYRDFAAGRSKISRPSCTKDSFLRDRRRQKLQKRKYATANDLRGTPRVVHYLSTTTTEDVRDARRPPQHTTSGYSAAAGNRFGSLLWDDNFSPVGISRRDGRNFKIFLIYFPVLPIKSPFLRADRSKRRQHQYPGAVNDVKI